MRGKQVLFPMGFHVTGAPVVGISKRIARKDEKTRSALMERWETIRRLVPEVELPTGLKAPRFALPETDDPDVNVYDMRLVPHEDGWIYGLFCAERKDPRETGGRGSRRPGKTYPLE